MSEEQLTALLAKIKEDAGLQEKLKGAADLDAAIALVKEAGFDVSKADWLKYQAKQTIELSDEELEGVSGGGGTIPILSIACHCLLLICGYSKKSTPKKPNPRSPCHHRGFLFLQSPSSSPKRPPIPGTISHLHRRF